MVILMSCLSRSKSQFLATCLLAMLGLAMPLKSSLQAQAVRQVEKPDLRVGDAWEYRKPYSGKNETWVIKEIKDGNVYVSKPNDCGRDTLVYTTEWAVVGFCGQKDIRGGIMPQTYRDPFQLMPFPVSEGQSWSLKYRSLGGYTRYNEGKALGWEKVTVPAGTFEALKVQVITQGLGGTNINSIRWYSPEVNNFIKSISTTEGHNDFELVSYKRGDGK